MAEQKTQNTHYVPEWLLKKFRQPSLYELDIFTGNTTIRNPKNAASDLDLWPDDIEDNLSGYDNHAAQIYRNKIAGQTEIALIDEECVHLSEWLAQFYIRAPKRLANAAKFLDENKNNLSNYIRDAVYNNREKHIALFRQKFSAEYDRAVLAIGKDLAEAQILDAYVDLHVKSGKHQLPSADDVYHYYMRNNQSEKFGAILRSYKWTWLRTATAFVIGDHPLVSFHAPTGNWDYGIDRPNVEISMPFSVNLTLFMTRETVKGVDKTLPCDEALTWLLNCRQRAAAIKHVFGNSPEALDFISRECSF